MVVMLAMTTVIVDPGHTFADQGDGGKVISAYMTYNESQYDVFNDTLWKKCYRPWCKCRQ